MPTSNMRQISDVMWFVEKLKPRRTIDIGIGCGKYGFLIREFMEVQMDGLARFSTASTPEPDRQGVVVDGVEVFEDYLTPLHALIYNNIMIGDALEVMPGLPQETYDLAFASDVLEHFNEEGCMRFLAECRRIATAVVVVVPNGVLEQGAYHGNEWETHRSTWLRRDLRRVGAACVIASDNFLIALFGESPLVAAVAKLALLRWRYRGFVPEWMGRSRLAALGRSLVCLFGRSEKKENN